MRHLLIQYFNEFLKLINNLERLLFIKALQNNFSNGDI